MFNSLREELNKIALIEDEELEMMDTGIVGGDDGAADDELVDDEDFFMEDDEDNDILDEDIDSLIDAMIISEGIDEYEDDDEDSLDYQDGVVGDGNTIDDDDDDYDDYDDVDIGGVTNSIHDDIEEDDEEELDELLEMLDCGGCGVCDDCIDNGVHGDEHDLYGDSSDMPCGDVPPSPQYSRLAARRASGREFVDYGNANYQKYGKVFLDKSLMSNMTVDNDDFDAEGNDYDLYASAGNIYDDDENEEYYGIRNRVKTNELYGRHSVNSINAAELDDRFDNNEDALDESVAMFLQNYLDY